MATFKLNVPDLNVDSFEQLENMVELRMFSRKNSFSHFGVFKCIKQYRLISVEDNGATWKIVGSTEDENLLAGLPVLTLDMWPKEHAIPKAVLLPGVDGCIPDNKTVEPGGNCSGLAGIKSLNTLKDTVDLHNVETTSGKPITPETTNINQATGMQNDYIVLSAEERSKGFVRPVRTSYIHQSSCGVVTKMNLKIAETYARDPAFYSETYCCHCKSHFPLSEFVWDGTNIILGT